MPRSRRPNGAQARADRARELLARVLPEPIVELLHEDAWQLLVATILSAQSTDKLVNTVTPELFKRWPTPDALASANPDEVEQVIRSTGYYNQKRKAIMGSAQRIVEAYGGRVPDAMEELTTLPGVGRKTASVVLGTIWDKAEGISVDTHCFRLARRLKLTAGEAQDHVERDLMKAFPRDDWVATGHRMVLYGRYVCVARKPRCAICPLNETCPSAEAEPEGSVEARVERARAHIVEQSPFQRG